MANHMTSFFKERFNRDTTLTISRTSASYPFFISEYKHGIEKDPNGNLIVRTEKERLIRLKKYISQIITMGSDAYSYFINEYRENALSQDLNGNILLNDEVEERKMKM